MYHIVFTSQFSLEVVAMDTLLEVSAMVVVKCHWRASTSL